MLKAKAALIIGLSVAVATTATVTTVVVVQNNSRNDSGFKTIGLGGENSYSLVIDSANVLIGGNVKTAGGTN